MSPLFRLAPYLRPYLGRLAAGVILLAVGGALMAAVVSTAKPLVNEVMLGQVPPVPTEPSGLDGMRVPTGIVADLGRNPAERISSWLSLDGARPFVRVPLIILAIFFLRGLFLYFGQYLTIRSGVGFIRDLRVKLFDSVIRQSMDFYLEIPSGVILARVLNDVQQLQRVSTTMLADFIRVGAMAPFLLVTAIVHDWRISIVAAVALPLLGYPTVRLGKRLRRASIASHDGLARVASRLTESISGAPVIQGFGQQSRETERFAAAVDGMVHADLKAARARSLSPALMELMGAAVGGGLFFVAGRSIAEGVLNPGDFTVVLVCLGLLFMSLRRINSLYADLQTSSVAASRVFEMMDRRPTVEDRADATVARPFSRSIDLEGVRFRYGDEWVLDGIDLSLKMGEVVALVGSSGSGKSTLAQLIPRFLDPVEGQIKIDGCDLVSLTLASLRAQIGVVRQETLLFDDSVRDNIAYGRPQATQAEVEQAAIAAHADGFIRALPQGYGTRLGERGTRLSMGQRQRIAIARAILKDPPILILDEATSALDAESEHEVQAALDRLLQGRTSLVIAHRLSTVRRADRILVLEAGRVVEEGDHATLIAADGRYARLHALQFADDVDPR